MVCIFRYSFDFYLPIIGYCLFAALSTGSSSLRMVFESTRGRPYNKNLIFRITMNTIVLVSSYTSNSYRRYFKLKFTIYTYYTVHF